MKTERRQYPCNSRATCDVVLDLSNGVYFWIEVKGAWKEYWRQRGNERLCRSYLLNPLVPGMDKSKAPTAALDIRKLEKLEHPHAAYVGFMIVGFDSEKAPMDADVGELIHHAGIGLLPWTTVATGWPDPCRPVAAYAAGSGIGRLRGSPARRRCLQG